MILWICDRCNRELQGNPRFCPYCAYTIYKPEELCDACQHRVSRHDKAGCIVCDARWIDNPAESKRCAVTTTQERE